MSRNQTCASCECFPIDEALENGGVAECAAYEQPAAWNDKFCVLYSRGKDVAARRPLVAKLMELKPE